LCPHIKNNRKIKMNIKILVFNNEFEAKLLNEILNEKNIPHIVRSYHDSVYDGLWQMQSSWGHLEAPEEYRDEILQTYNQMSPGYMENQDQQS
jgi:hypothetical protein